MVNPICFLESDVYTTPLCPAFWIMQVTRLPFRLSRRADSQPGFRRIWLWRLCFRMVHVATPPPLHASQLGYEPRWPSPPSHQLDLELPVLVLVALPCLQLCHRRGAKAQLKVPNRLVRGLCNRVLQ